MEKRIAGIKLVEVSAEARDFLSPAHDLEPKPIIFGTEEGHYEYKSLEVYEPPYHEPKIDTYKEKHYEPKSVDHPSDLR